MKKQDAFEQMKLTLKKVLFMNWFVALMKIALGAATNSASIMADGLHSFSDGFSNVVGLVGLNYASKPKDSDHPYGHKKIENIAAIAIAMMLFFVCVEVFKNAVARLVNPVVPEITALSFIILALSIAINVFVMRYELRRGKELKSEILVADSHHTRSDVYLSIVVIAGLIGTKLGITVLDPIVSIIAAFLIGYVAFDILKHTSKALTDAAMLDPKEIKQEVLKVRGVEGCHRIRTRGREDEIMVDLHVTVQNSMRVGRAHEITAEIESSLKRSFIGVVEVIVHVEPHDRKNSHESKAQKN
ncbi:MAG: cation diffusion facilitator family transporter [Candidatus Omnitrophota bacterium]